MRPMHVVDVFVITLIDQKCQLHRRDSAKLSRTTPTTPGGVQATKAVKSIEKLDAPHQLYLTTASGIF